MNSGARVTAGACGAGAGPSGPLLVFHGSLLADGEPVEIRVTSLADGLRLDAPGRPGWLLRRGVPGGGPDAPVDATDSLEMLRRVLELSLRGRFCLHASAVRVDETRVVAFAGESGVGKSTLARLVQEGSGGRWPRVADDALPAWPVGDEVVLDAAFPQPRLPVGERDVAARRRLVLAALYVLERRNGNEPLTVSPILTPTEAMAAVAGSTMSARLFDRRLLDEHLGFCREVALRVPVRRLAYPHRHEVAAGVVAAVADDLRLTPPQAGGAYGA